MSGRLSIAQTAERGEPLRGVLVIDCHAHLLPADGANFTPWTDPQGMLSALDALGIDRACISSLRALHDDVSRGNDEIVALTSLFPDRFVGFAVYNPNDPRRGAEELERCLRAPGIRGIKVHPASYVHDYPLDGPSYEPMWGFARLHGWPVLTHAGPRSELHRCGPEILELVATRHPEVNLVVGHSGSYDSWGALEAHIGVVLRHPNVFLDIAAMARFYGAVEQMVRRVGSERVLFGSDGPFHSFDAELGHVAHARISDADKERVLGLNTARLLGLRR